MTLAAGTRLGPYEITSPLGAGGMGEVYRAVDRRLGRPVAVKVLSRALAQSPDALARFEREAQAVASLNHPNIVALHDVGLVDGVSYAVTELLDGVTLREQLRDRGPLGLRQTLELAAQFARGLAAAHARGIVHRDLKPENLFVTADGRAKLLDFGIAALDPAHPRAGTEETTLLTEPGMVLGTTGYMAPEQARGEAATSRTDVFAFGVILYEMLTGANPFAKPTSLETAAAVLRDSPAPLVEVVPGMLPALSRFVARCLEKRPEDRPESTRDVAFFLEALQLGVMAPPTEAPALAPVESPPAAPPRQTLLVSSVAAALLTALLSVAYVWVSGERLAGDSVAEALERASVLVRRSHDERLAELALTARLVASFPDLRALLGTDAATIRDFLQNYRQRSPGTPMLAALDAQGATMARSDRALGTAAMPDRDVAMPLLGASAPAAIIAVDGTPYHAALAPAEAGDTVFGYVVAARPLDEPFARAVMDATGCEVVVLSEGRVLGTTVREEQLPWTSLDGWRSAADGAGPRSIRIGSERYLARVVALAEQPAVALVLLRSYDEAAAPFRRLGFAIALIGVGAALGTLLAVRLLARATP